jgi:hypothetical protein
MQFWNTVATNCRNLHEQKLHSRSQASEQAVFCLSVLCLSHKYRNFDMDM